MDTHNDFRLANDPETNQDTLEKLSTSSSELIRGAVALNPNASEKTLMHLVGDKSRHVAKNLMNNKHRFSIKTFEITACKHTKLRIVTVEDSEFILSLRLDNNLNKYLSPVDDDIKKQKEWLVSYKEREKNRAEFYFIITSLYDVPIGSVRLYDFKGDSFCWGSWMVHQDAPSYTAIESALSVYEFAFYQLGFQRSHFDVRKENLKVVKFHKRFGAKEISSDTDTFYFDILKDDYETTKRRYHKFFFEVE